MKVVINAEAIREETKNYRPHTEFTQDQAKTVLYEAFQRETMGDINTQLKNLWGSMYER